MMEMAQDMDDQAFQSVLKYGFCSYFALAYDSLHTANNQFLAILEYDEELEKEYLVHILAESGDRWIDAEGQYVDWQESVKDIVDIEYMELIVKEIDRNEIMRMIERDLIYDQEFFEYVKAFVKKLMEKNTEREKALTK